MEWVSKFEALHFALQHPLKCNPTTPRHFTALNSHNSTALHCIVLTTVTILHHHYFAALHCTHYTAPPLLSCTSRQCTAILLFHWISLHSIHYTAPPLLYYTSLHMRPHNSTEFHYIALYSLHFSTSGQHIDGHRTYQSVLLSPTTTNPLHFIVPQLIHYTSVFGAVLSNEIHQHCMQLHFTAWSTYPFQCSRARYEIFIWKNIRKYWCWALLWCAFFSSEIHAAAVFQV